MAVTPFQLTEPFSTDSFNSRVSEINAEFDNLDLANKYVWSKNESTFDAVENGTGAILSSAVTSTGDTISITLYSNYTVNENGTITLTGNSVTISGLYNNPPDISSYVGYYGYDTPGNISDSVYRISSSSSISGSYSSGNYYLRISSCIKLSYGKVFKFIEYVNSYDPTAYPPSVSDGYTYTPLGQIGNKARITTGSYVGTGTYGSSYPNSLTFDFAPTLVFISESWGNVSYGNASYTNGSIVSSWPTTYTQYYGFGETGGSFGKKSSDGKTLTWYNTNGNGNSQWNTSGNTYRYIAIG